MDQQQNSQQPSLQIKASDEKIKGEYANMVQLLHTKEEFVLDFINMFPPNGTLNARLFIFLSSDYGIFYFVQEFSKGYEIRGGIDLLANCFGVSKAFYIPAQMFAHFK